MKELKILDHLEQAALVRDPLENINNMKLVSKRKPNLKEAF